MGGGWKKIKKRGTIIQYQRVICSQVCGYSDIRKCESKAKWRGVIAINVRKKVCEKPCVLQSHLDIYGGKGEVEGNEGVGELLRYDGYDEEVDLNVELFAGKYRTAR